MSKLNITQFAKKVGISRQYVYDLHAKGHIKIKRDGRGPYLSKKDLEKVKKKER